MILEAPTMSRRSKRRHRVTSQMQAAASAAGVPASDKIEISTPPPLRSQEVFRVLFQKAVAVAKNQLNATGRIDPTALLVYGKNFKDAEESTTRVVSIAWKNELHKEVVRTRLREKTEQENVSAVVLLMPVHASPAHEVLAASKPPSNPAMTWPSNPASWYTSPVGKVSTLNKGRLPLLVIATVWCTGSLLASYRTFLEPGGRWFPLNPHRNA